jgi:hypothetical protein
MLAKRSATAKPSNITRGGVRRPDAAKAERHHDGCGDVHREDARPVGAGFPAAWTSYFHGSDCTPHPTTRG